MSFDFRSLPLQCAAVALAFQAVPGSAEAATAGGASITCTVNDLWASDHPSLQGAYTTLPPVTPTALEASYDSTEAGSAPRWTVTYKSTGADRMRGAAKARVLRHGVLWWVNPKDLGVSEQEAISALLRAGAVISRPEGDGRVYYRAREEHAEDVAQKAAELLGHGYVEAGVRKADFNAKPGKSVGSAHLSFDGSLTADVAMLRLEGRLSRSPLQFIEYIPAGMIVLPFGTSFVVHVRPADFPALRDYIGQEGNSVLLVGASGPVENGSEMGKPIRYCGGNALADRFPTPVVTSNSSERVVIDVEGQALRVADGDTVLIVQRPLYGRGLEIAIMRFASK